MSPVYIDIIDATDPSFYHSVYIVSSMMNTIFDCE